MRNGLFAVFVFASLAWCYSDNAPDHACEFVDEPYYWGVPTWDGKECKFLNDKFQSGKPIPYGNMVIVVPEDIVSGVLTAEFDIHHGSLADDLWFNEFGYYVMVFGQTTAWHGPDVSVYWFVNGEQVSSARYLQDYSFAEAGEVFVSELSNQMVHTFQGSISSVGPHPGHALIVKLMYDDMRK